MVNFHLLINTTYDILGIGLATGKGDRVDQDRCSLSQVSYLEQKSDPKKSPVFKS